MQPIQPLVWLNRIDFKNEIEDVPVTFRIAEHLAVTVRKVIDGWLTELITEATVSAINDELINSVDLPTVDLSDSTQKWLALICPFLANAAWSKYILRGNVNNTDTGPVVKSDTTAEPISDRQRAELNRDYHAEAERCARKLTLYATKHSDVCGVVVHSGRPSVHVIGGRKRSKFD